MQDDDRTKTRPWMTDEYLTVDGFKLVYTINKNTGEMSVHMPGKATYSLEVLKAQGRNITMPRILRTEHHA